MEFELRKIESSDGCNSLSLGDEEFTPLKTFLRKEAKKLHQENLAITFVIVIKGTKRVLAYLTTVCTHIAVEQFNNQDAISENFKYKDYPAIKLARLAVDISQRGNDLGSKLVDFLVGFATEQVMPYTGCRFLVVDAKSKSVGFYIKKGFAKIGDHEDGQSKATTMIIDLGRLPKI